MDELKQQIAAAGCPPQGWQAPGIKPSPVGRTYTQSELDAAVAAERERCGHVYGSREVAMTAEIKRLRAALTAIGVQCAADAQGGEWTTSISRVQALVKSGLVA